MKSIPVFSTSWLFVLFFFLFQNNVNTQLGISPVIIATITDKPTLAMIENSTPVNARLLRKALSPPVTIRNFFKPCSKFNETKIMKKMTTDTGNCQADTRNDDKTGTLTKSTEKLSNHELHESSSFKNRDTTHTDKDTTHTDDKDTTHTDDKDTTHTDKNTECKRTPTVSDSKPNDKCKKTTLKRAAQENLPRKDSGKRCKKQGSILQSFHNSTRSHESRRCPICNSPFSPTLTNQEINDHMDNCLIE